MVSVLPDRLVSVVMGVPVMAQEAAPLPVVEEPTPWRKSP